MASRPPRSSKMLLAHIDQSDVRLSLLALIGARDATPTELAAALGISPSKARYHLRKLIEWGLVERVGERSRRGVVEASYAVAGELLFDEEDFKALSSADQLRALGAILRLLEGDILDSLRSGRFYKRSDSATIRFPMQVDEEGWRDLARLHKETFEASRRIQQRSAERLSSTGEDPILALSGQLCIELPKELKPRRPSKRRAD